MWKELKTKYRFSPKNESFKNFFYELLEGAGDFKQQRKERYLEHQALPQRKQNNDANLFRNKFQNLHIQQPQE